MRRAYALGSWMMIMSALMTTTTACSGAKPTPDDGPQDRVLYSPPPEAKEPPALPRTAPILATAQPQRAPDDFEQAPEDSLGQEPRELLREELELLLAQGPSFPLSQLDLKPHRERGQVIGYRIDGFMTPQAAQALDGALRVGDVITHAQGISMLSPNNYHLAWTRLRGASTIRLDFRRDEVPSYALWIVQP